MSCHNIGRGMDSVTKVVAEMYIKKEITKDIAFRLFHALKKGVHWCDGNEYEATASLKDLLCGRCLKQFGDSEHSVNVWDMVDDLDAKTNGWREVGNELVQQYEELFKAICDKKGKGYGKSFNGDNAFYDLLEKETVSSDVCESCLTEILNKYLEIN